MVIESTDIEVIDDGFVYFVLDGFKPSEDGRDWDDRSYVKIGYSKNPEARLGALQTASPERLDLMGYIPGNPSTERQFHELFGHLRRKGEWFALTRQLYSCINQFELIKHHWEHKPAFKAQKRKQILSDEQVVDYMDALYAPHPGIWHKARSTRVDAFGLLIQPGEHFLNACGYEVHETNVDLIAYLFLKRTNLRFPDKLPGELFQYGKRMEAHINFKPYKKIMAGITTSETMAGEQPKDDVLGSRVDELTVQVDELRKEVALLRCRVTDKFEALEKKANGRKTKNNRK